MNATGVSSDDKTHIFLLKNNSSIWRATSVHRPGSCVRSTPFDNRSEKGTEEKKSTPISSQTMPLTPKKTNSTGMKSASNSSFQQFERETSDVWDFDQDDELLMKLKIDSTLVQKAANHVLKTHSSSPPRSNPSQSSKSESSFTKSPQVGDGSPLPAKPPNHRQLGATATSAPLLSAHDQAKAGKFLTVINGKSKTLIDGLRTISWSGVPKSVRPITWRILCGYLPPAEERRQITLDRKRQEYAQLLESYFHTRNEEQHQHTFRQIHIDVPRMNPLIPLFQSKQVQEIFERILYIWAIRHPASGYVQGINDLVTPFFVVFLNEFLDKDVESGNIDIATIPREDLDRIEADSFWCMSKLLDGIQDNYTFAQPGIQRKVSALKELTLRIDATLYNHIEAQGIEFLQFSFRWMNNLLMRELPLRCTIRLWDTYLAEPDGFADFHLFVCAAFLTKFSKTIQQETDFQGVMTKLQNLPTDNWSDSDIGEMTAEAYKLKYIFAGAPQHYKQGS